MFLAKLYNDLESRLYSFDKINGTESNLASIKIFLTEENQRIHEELLSMNNNVITMLHNLFVKSPIKEFLS